MSVDLDVLKQRIREFGDPDFFAEAVRGGFNEYAFVSGSEFVLDTRRGQQVLGGFILYHPDGRVVLGWTPKQWYQGKPKVHLARIQEGVNDLPTVELWLTNHAATAEERRPIRELLEGIPDR